MQFLIFIGFPIFWPERWRLFLKHIAGKSRNICHRICSNETTVCEYNTECIHCVDKASRQVAREFQMFSHLEVKLLGNLFLCLRIYLLACIQKTNLSSSYCTAISYEWSLWFFFAREMYPTRLVVSILPKLSRICLSQCHLLPTWCTYGNVFTS